MVQTFIKIIVYLLLIGTSLFSIVLLYRGFSARKKPVPENWHKIPKLNDNLIQQGFTEFEKYLEEEKELLDNIYNDVLTEESFSFERYAKNNTSSPYVKDENLNASFQFSPKKEAIKGGILLVHGLKDSPYHLRTIGKFFSDNGYYVIGLRLPGHGTTPGALLNVHWKDWYAAVHFGAEMVLKKIEDVKDSKFYVGGFSTGGALTLRYVLEATGSQNSQVPDKLLLLSPAIGVSPLAEVTNWHKLISWIPYFERFKWLDIKPEYDPFKYNSFAKNAADQIFELTKENWDLIEEISKNKDRQKKLPPIYAFQSRVDATVKTNKLLEMYAKIASVESELFIFDINRKFELELDEKLKEGVLGKEIIKDIKAQVFIVSNKVKKDGNGYKSGIFIKANSQSAKEKLQLKKLMRVVDNLEWPANVFALSHICIPISPDDRYYGRKSILGGINIKGEHKIFLLGNDLARLTYNPFFDLLKTQIEINFLNFTGSEVIQ